MIFADILLMACNSILAVSMVPQIIKSYKTKTGLSIFCCSATVLPLAGISFSNYLIGYSVSAILPALITCFLWAVLLAMSIKYK